MSIYGSGGRCIYHRRPVGNKEAKEKCIPRHCRLFQNVRVRTKQKLKELDEVFGRR